MLPQAVRGPHRLRLRLGPPGVLAYRRVRRVACRHASCANPPRPRGLVHRLGRPGLQPGTRLVPSEAVPWLRTGFLRGGRLWGRWGLLRWPVGRVAGLRLGQGGLVPIVLAPGRRPRRWVLPLTPVDRPVPPRRTGRRCDTSLPGREGVRGCPGLPGLRPRVPPRLSPAAPRRRTRR